MIEHKYGDDNSEELSRDTHLKFGLQFHRNRCPHYTVIHTNEPKSFIIENMNSCPMDAQRQNNKMSYPTCEDWVRA